MTKQIAKAEETGLVPFEEKMKAMATASAQQEVGGSGGIISLRGGILSYMGEPMPNNEMEVIVLGSSGEHTYYDTPFDPDRITPPTCFSVFNLAQNAAPHESVPTPEDETCSGCWAHKFKSAENGRGRACSVRRRLALISSSALETENGLEDADVAIMKVPPTSVSNWGAYVNKIAASYQRPPAMVVTKIKVSPHPKWQYVVDFEASELVEVELFEQITGMCSGVEGALLAPFDMTLPEEEEEEVKPLKTDRKSKKKVIRKKTRGGR